MTYNTILLEKDTRGVGTITLNRPDKHNALNAELIAETRDAIRHLKEDKKTRLVVLTGAGKSFCAGGDLNWFAANIDRTRQERIDESASLAHLLYEMNTLPKPLIGRINGQAFGGGTGMISVCDITVGVESTNYGLTEVRLGFLPANISPYVVDRIGKANARAVMLSGALFNAHRAKDIGLLTFVTSEEKLDKAVENIVLDHLEAAPEAVAATKTLIDFVATNNIKDCMTYTSEALADAWESEEGQAGVAAFLNKKLPPWRSGQ